jgi:hypothetical protein
MFNGLFPWAVIMIVRVFYSISFSGKVPIRNNRQESHQAVIKSNIEGSVLKTKSIQLPFASEELRDVTEIMNLQ